MKRNNKEMKKGVYSIQKMEIQSKQIYNKLLIKDLNHKCNQISHLINHTNINIICD